MRTMIKAVPIFAVILAGCLSPSPDDFFPSRETSPPQRSPGGLRPSGAATLPGAPVTQMRINGEVVEADEILRPIRDTLAEKAATLPPESYQRLVQRESETAISDTMARVLLHQQASLRLGEREKEYLEQIVVGEVRRIVTQQYGGIERSFERDLASRGQSLEEARDEIRRGIVIRRHLELTLKPKVPEPTRAELLELFQANLDKWRRPPRRRMSLIDVRLPEGVSESDPEQLALARTEAGKRIEQARTQLKESVPFAEVAKRYSDGLNASEGGGWGWVNLGGVQERFKPAVEKLYTLEEGQISDAIETPAGFYLVRCDEVDPGFEPTFESVQAELKQQQFEAQYSQLIVDHVNELRASAEIEPPDARGARLFLAAVMQTAPRPGGIPQP